MAKRHEDRSGRRPSRSALAAATLAAALVALLVGWPSPLAEAPVARASVARASVARAAGPATEAVSPSTVVGVAVDPAGGQWSVTAAGVVTGYGGAAVLGGLGGVHLNQPVVGIAATPSGDGYWLVAADGGIFDFGDATFHGSTGNIHLNQPVVGMAATPTGNGYWLVASDGGIFDFGDAPFLGSLAGAAGRYAGMAWDAAVNGYVIVSTTGVPTVLPGKPAAARAVPAGINLGGSANAAFSFLPVNQQHATINRIAASGLTWMRIDVPFASVEPDPGRFDWSTDTLVKDALADHLHVDALIWYPPAWARESSGAPNPTDFATFAGDVAARYGPLGVSTFEVGNEINEASEWGVAVDPAAYATLLEDSYAAIKAHEPGTRSTVLTAGLAPAVDARNGSELSPATFLTGLYQAGGGDAFDAVAVHPYSYPALPSTPGYTFAELPEIYAIMRSYGGGAKKIWATEYGAPTAGTDAPSGPTVTLAEQADEIKDAFSLADQMRYMGPLFVFDWEDDPVDHSFGLLGPGGAAKPALGVVQSLYATP